MSTAKHGYEPEPWGSGLCICGKPDDADCHWPDAPDEPRHHHVLGPDELGG